MINGLKILVVKKKSSIFQHKKYIIMFLRLNFFSFYFVSSTSLYLIKKISSGRFFFYIYLFLVYLHIYIYIYIFFFFKFESSLGLSHSLLLLLLNEKTTNGRSKVKVGVITLHCRSLLFIYQFSLGGFVIYLI